MVAADAVGAVWVEERGTVRKLLIGINVLLAASLAIWPAIFFLGFFLRDVPGVLQDPRKLLVLASIWAYPAFVLLGNIVFWSILQSGSQKAQVRWTLVGCLGPLLVLLSGVLAWAADL